MTETTMAFALAGLGGFNAHGAGFLQAARDNQVEPDLVTATSTSFPKFRTYRSGGEIDFVAPSMDDRVAI